MASMDAASRTLSKLAYCDHPQLDSIKTVNKKSVEIKELKIKEMEIDDTNNEYDENCLDFRW